MLFQKFLLLSLPVFALAATTTTEEEEDDITTSSRSTTTSSGFKSSTTATTTTSSSKAKVTDDEEEEEMVTITTTSKGAKVTTIVSKNSTKEEDTSDYKFKSFGDLIIDLPDCTRTCFETPVKTNVTEGCAKLENWNCICHFYNPSFYKKVFNDTLPVTTTTRTSATRRVTGTATSTTAEATETAEPEQTEEDIAQDDFFTCIDESCKVKAWGASRDDFFATVDDFTKYCETEQPVYDEARNKKDYQDLKDAEEALAKKKKAEEDAKKKKSAAGNLSVAAWTVTAAVGFAVAFTL